MKNMNSKPLKFLFACCLFLAVGIGCLKSTAAHVIRDAYIGSAFSFRTSDVVALACPDLEIDRAMEIQRLVERHPQLDRVIHRYLRAYAAFLAGKNTPLEKMDNSRSFARLNRDILKAVKRSSNSSALAISDEEFLAQLTEAEDEAEWILLNRLPPTLRNLGEPAIAATRVYGAVTSFWVQAVLLLGVLLPLLMPVVLYAQRSSLGIIPFFRLTPLVSPPAKEGSASDTASSYSAGIGAYYRSCCRAVSGLSSPLPVSRPPTGGCSLLPTGFWGAVCIWIPPPSCGAGLSLLDAEEPSGSWLPGFPLLDPDPDKPEPEFCRF